MTIQDVERIADHVEAATGNWVRANWMRSQAQELLAEIQRTGRWS